jgi:hypothetical protein
MAQREATRLLTGRVEVDDAYLGGEHEGKAGRGSENKVPFVAAVQTNEKGHPIAVRLDRVKAFSKECIESWGKKALAASATVGHLEKSMVTLLFARVDFGFCDWLA